MRKRLFNLAAKLTAIATIVSSVMAFTPVRAAEPTNMSDTLNRIQISVNATHALSMTLPAGGIPATQTLTVTYTSFPTDMVAGSASVTCAGGGSATPSSAGSTDTLTLTAGATACTGLLTVTGFTMTNPATKGSYTVSLGGTGGITGTFAVSIVSSDQVTVTATVDPALTFNVYANTTHADNTNYTVPLGTLISSAVTASNDTSINSIWLDVDTNASGGAAVTVLNANGSSGLKSTSTPADFIANAASAMAAGTANYGLCVASVQAATGTLAKGTSYSTGTCTAGGATNAVKALSSATPDQIINTSGAPIAGGYSEVLVNAAISGVTPAHNDYTDTLTFVATGTF